MKIRSTSSLPESLKTVTENNVAHFKAQLKSLGYSFDWEREVNTTDPEYYKWTQWIFLKLFKKGLAYKTEIISSAVYGLGCPTCSPCPDG